MSEDNGKQPPPSTDSSKSKKHDQSDQVVPAVIEEVLRSAGIEPSDPRFTRALEVSLKLVSGSLPLPPAEYIEPWEKIIPGTGAKIVEWTEKQGDHRRRLEVFRSEQTERRLDRGQLIAAAVAMFGLFLSAYVAVNNGPAIVALGLALFSIGGPTACLIIAARWKT